MGDLLHLRSNSTGASEHREIGDIRSSLIHSLSKVADEQGIKEVIQLLEDIRSYQDRPKMIKAFAENEHKLADEVKNHDGNILELLLDDYLREHELTSDMLQGDRHESEFQGHVQYFVINALRGYQEAVENIRSEVQGRPNSVPFIPVNPKHPYELKRKLTRPAYGTSAYYICQILRAAWANNEINLPLFEKISDNSELQDIMAKFGNTTENISQSIMDSYLEYRHNQGQSDELSASDFENYLTELLAQIQRSCDDDLYQKLLYWNPGHTIPAAPAPASMRVRSTLVPENPNTIVLKANKKTSVSEDETYTVNTGYSTKIAYAVHDSIIEIEDGAKLDLFMISNNVKVKLMGNTSSVKISRVTRNCESIHILGKDGKALTGDSPNLELSDEVIEKLEA